MTAGGRKMEYEMVELEEKIVQGIGLKTTNEGGKSMQDIGKMWQHFFADGIYQKVSNKVNHKTIGLYTDYEGDYTKPYYFMAGVQVGARGTMPWSRECGPKNYSKRKIC